MIGETCEFIMLNRDTCSQPANPCPVCHRAYCSQCYPAHKMEHEPGSQVSAVELSAPQLEEVPAEAEKKGSPFDCLMVTSEEAARHEEARAANEPVVGTSEAEEEPEAEEGTLLTEEVTKICKAIERLAKRGLNMRAVIALLHDSNPTISKKHIKTVLEGLRELPAIYGKDPRSPDPFKKS